MRHIAAVNRSLKRLAMPALMMLVLAPGLSLLSGCEKTAEEKIAEHAVPVRSLGMPLDTFATGFNRTMVEVLTDRKDDDPAHTARLYRLDASRLHVGKQEKWLETTVGPAQTSILASVDKAGELKAVGVLLTDRSQAAHEEFLLCAETSARSFVTSADERGKLLSIINRLTGVALNNPGQRMTEVVGERLLSVEIVPQGLLFQVAQKQ
ncbi:attG domain containing protein [Herbaspirillum lusitanum]|uniref:AttG domain containing protein n=1 Tax=Herbaspirillum lusitanum TaxID=213312 RepID=A0ABW9AAW4_9BURK